MASEKKLTKQLAEKNHEIIMVARNEELAAKIKEEIIQATGNKNIKYFIADLSSKKQIQKLAEEIRNNCDKIDILFNNAGGIFSKKIVTEDDVEYTFAVNHLAYFMFTGLILDLIRKSDAGYIMNTTSVVHTRGKINFDEIVNPTKYGGLGAYNNSKLANIYFTYALADKLKDTKIKVNCIHPGFVRSNFGRKTSNFLVKTLLRTFSPIMGISSKKSASQIIEVVLGEKYQDLTGKYFDRSKLKKSNAISYDTDIREKLWKLSESLTENPYKTLS